MWTIIPDGPTDREIADAAYAAEAKSTAPPPEPEHELTILMKVRLARAAAECRERIENGKANS